MLYMCICITTSLASYVYVAGMSDLSSKLGHIGPQMGQIWDFLRSVSVHFGAGRQNVLKLILKSPRFVLFVANLAQFRAKTKIPDPGHYHTRGKTRITQALFPPLVFAPWMKGNIKVYSQGGMNTGKSDTSPRDFIK